MPLIWAVNFINLNLAIREALTTKLKAINSSLLGVSDSCFNSVPNFIYISTFFTVYSTYFWQQDKHPKDPKFTYKIQNFTLHRKNEQCQLRIKKTCTALTRQRVISKKTGNRSQNTLTINPLRLVDSNEPLVFIQHITS